MYPDRLAVALQHYRQEAVEAVQELLELYREALDKLDDAIDEMKKEGGELANLIHRAGI